MGSGAIGHYAKPWCDCLRSDRLLRPLFLPTFGDDMMDYLEAARGASAVIFDLALLSR
jgi:hypothetical protein